MTNTYTYDPYGVTTETKAVLTNVFNPWRYAGQYQDTTTGLYKMGARYYQPELGRWTQPDPSGLETNAFAYVGGDPVNYIDPSGEWHTKVLKWFKRVYNWTVVKRAREDCCPSPPPGYQSGDRTSFCNPDVAEATGANRHSVAVTCRR